LQYFFLKSTSVKQTTLVYKQLIFNCENSAVNYLTRALWHF